MRRVDSIMFNLYLILLLATIVFSGAKVYRLFGEPTADVLQTVSSVVFGSYFLYRLVARYRKEKKLAADFVFIILLAVANFVAANFL